MIVLSKVPSKKIYHSTLDMLSLDRDIVSTSQPQATESVAAKHQAFEGVFNGQASTCGGRWTIFPRHVYNKTEAGKFNRSYNCLRCIVLWVLHVFYVNFFTFGPSGIDKREKQNRQYFYLLIMGCTVLTLLLLTLAVLLARKYHIKREDRANKASSILVYPSQHGSKHPQFLTKEIHFSLPPLRSTSLGDLHENEQDSDVDIETESLLPTSQHNQRSHSFSCYGLGVIEPALYRNTLDLDDIQWPDGHIGRIWFSLRYEPSTEKLLVSLLKAKNLPSRTLGTVNSCDPFVRLHLMPDERRYLQSKQKKKTCHPYFDETLVFHVSPKDMSDHYLKLAVVDGGRTKRSAEIGHVTYLLKDLEIGDGFEQQLFKLDLEKETTEIRSDLGELLLSLVYNENLCRLTATVIEARRLKFQGDKHEAYVRLTLNQHYKAVKEKRTRVVRSTPESVVTFTEGFNFKLSPSQMDITSLAFHIFQSTSGYGRDKLIGKCVLGSYMFARGKALIHWNTAIANPMEQTQQWHVLCE